MNNVTINADGVTLPEWTGNACLFALKVLDEIKHDNWELSVLFCDDKKITQLNSQYRNKNEPTDILSFRLDELTQERYFPGDIVISLDTLRENSLYYNVTQDEELRRLLIHGILHLEGMDHETNEENEPMLAFQEKLLNKLGQEQIIGRSVSGTFNSGGGGQE